MKKRSMSINSILKQLDKTTKILKESYIFDGEGDSDADATIGYAEEGEDDMPPMEDEGMPQEEEPNSISNGSDTENVRCIRDAALKGIEAYKNDVNNIFYSFYKKIFLECDRVMEESLGDGQKIKKA